VVIKLGEKIIGLRLDGDILSGISWGEGSSIYGMKSDGWLC
jgi:hypothetical protein